MHFAVFLVFGNKQQVNRRIAREFLLFCQNRAQVFAAELNQRVLCRVVTVGTCGQQDIQVDILPVARRRDNAFAVCSGSLMSAALAVPAANIIIAPKITFFISPP